jgi:PAS domain S-box-containing protein
MQPPADSRRILVVDDDPTLCFLARQSLEQAGFEVAEVGDGPEALAACGAFRPDLVLLDVNLPTLDGHAVCATLRRARDGERLPVLMMTGADDPDSINQAYEAGATDFITKPINWLILTHRVRYMIRAAQAVEALRVSEDRLTRAQRLARLGSWELDVACGSLHCPSELAQMLGLAAAPVPTLEGLRSRVHEDDRGRLEALVRAALDQGQPYRMDYRVILESGESRVLHEQVDVAVDEQQHPTEIVGTVQDITERAQLEAELLQAQKMQAVGTFAGGIAHDFNNLLAVIVGYTELALRDVMPGRAAWRHLQEALAASKQACDLVKQILTFSRRRDPERRPVQLARLVSEGLTIVRSSLPSSIVLRTEIRSQRTAAAADATQIQQVLLNLCSNAEHAMRPGGGTLEVRVEPIDVEASLASTLPELKPGPYVRLTVRDTGQGMTPDVLKRIFEPFFTTKKTGEGTGLGLAVTRGIVESHGGAISVRSTPGAGTAFDVYLPRIEGVADDDVQAAAPASGAAPQRILFVDDNASVADMGREMLEQLGYRAVSFTDPREALAVFRAAPERFDLLITDQVMPHMTGDRLVQEVRRHRGDLPIIVCTGYSGSFTKESARSLGVAAYLFKPVLAEELDRHVRSALGRSPRVETN